MLLCGTKFGIAGVVRTSALLFEVSLVILIELLLGLLGLLQRLGLAA